MSMEERGKLYLKDVPEGEIEQVIENMHTALEEVQTGELTVATRSVEIDGVAVEEGQVIGLLNGKLAVSGDDLAESLFEMLELSDAIQAELITLYYQHRSELKRIFVSRPDVARRTMAVLLQSFGSIRRSILRENGSLHVRQDVFEQGRQLIDEYKSLASGQLRVSLDKLEAFLIGRNRLVGDVVELTLVDAPKAPFETAPVGNEVAVGAE